MANARKILIVEDDTDLRDTLVEQLSLHDEFEASAVDTGAKGASAAKADARHVLVGLDFDDSGQSAYTYAFHFGSAGVAAEVDWGSAAANWMGIRHCRAGPR